MKIRCNNCGAESEDVGDLGKRCMFCGVGTMESAEDSRYDEEEDEIGKYEKAEEGEVLQEEQEEADVGTDAANLEAGPEL